MARLAWRATRALSRLGFRLARQGVEKGVQRVLHGEKDVKRETIDGDYTLRGWRTWSRSGGAPESPGKRIHWNSRD